MRPCLCCLTAANSHCWCPACLAVCPPPPGPLRVDQEVYAELQATGEFDTMNLDVDEVGPGWPGGNRGLWAPAHADTPQYIKPAKDCLG
jgi:hypothetical protein